MDHAEHAPSRPTRPGRLPPPPGTCPLAPPASPHVPLPQDGEVTAAETAHYVGQDAGFDWAAQEGWSVAAAAQHSQEALDGADAGGTVSKAELAAHLRALLQVCACLQSRCGLEGAAARRAVQPDGRMVISRLQQPWSRLTRFWDGRRGSCSKLVNS